MPFTLLHQGQQLPGKEVKPMTRVLPVPHTDVAAWDDAPQPSPALVRVLDDVERALVPLPDPPTRPKPVMGHTPRPFAHD
jgi:hypothetical protein